jgi:hypothetical protein
MTSSPSLADLLKRGAGALNKLRQEDALPRDFTGATLVRLFCANANLAGLDLTGSEWDRCELSKIDFKDADLSNAYFHGGRLDDCDFTGATLEGASFEKVRLGRCDFTGAKGLDELELSDVVMHDVVGLDEPDDEDDEDGDGPREPEVTVLRDRLPKGFRRLPLEDLLAEAGKHVQTRLGTPGKEADVAALEEALRTRFPADYRSFLMRFGSLKVVGSAEHAFGFLNVYGIGDLEAAREDYLAEFKEWGFDPDWLDQKSPHDSRRPGTLAQKRTQLRDELKLGDVHLKKFFGDLHDAMRVAYQFMVPVMCVPDEMHQSVVCVGPDTQMYSVSMKGLTVEPPGDTFTARLLHSLEQIVVA